MVQPFPAPSLRELSSECETEGVYPDARNRSKISEPIKTARKPSARWNHRTTLPQRGSREGLHHSSGYSLKSQVSGDFHRPYATLMILAYTIHRTTLPQSALAGCQLPQRGSRERAVPFNVPPGNRNVAGDFHRPYEGRVAFNPPLGNRNVGGRFSSPLRKGCAIQPSTFPMAQVRDRRRGWWSR